MREVQDVFIDPLPGDRVFFKYDLYKIGVVDVDQENVLYYIVNFDGNVFWRILSRQIFKELYCEDYVRNDSTFPHLPDIPKDICWPLTDSFISPLDYRKLVE